MYGCIVAKICTGTCNRIPDRFRGSCSLSGPFGKSRREQVAAEIVLRSAVSQGAQSAGDPIPPTCEVIEVHVAELKQLFNAIDPSPFREKALDANAEEFIVAWARDASHDAPLALL